MTQSLVQFLSMTEVWVGGLGLSAFLTLFWVLRGAPPGQAVAAEDEPDAPRGGYRDRVVTAVSIGMTLILLGAYIAATQGVRWSIPAFALGFGTVLILVMINQKHRHGSPTLRRTLDVSTAALNASLVLGVLIVLNVLAFRYGGRPFDMTSERAYSLSSLSTRQIMSLERPVTFTTFYGRSKAAFVQQDRVRQLLELYKGVNPDKVQLDHVDPFRDLSRYETLAKRVPAVEVTQGGGVVVEYGEGEAADRVVVRNTDLFDVPAAQRFDPDVNRFETTFKGEDALTSALIRMRESKKPRVVFTNGHGEPSIEEMEVNKPGLGLFKARLAGTGAEVVSVNLLTTELPDDTSLVVIAGPKTPFQPSEVSRLKSHADRNGPLLLLLGDNPATGLDTFLKGFDLEVGKGFIVEPRLNLPPRVEVLVVPVQNQQHPILEPLNNQFAIFPRPAPLNLIGPSQPGANVVATVLLRTSVQSWAETDLNATQVSKEPADPAGPFAVAAAVTDRPAPGPTALPTPKMVVFSSRNLADNMYIQRFPANLDLLMNAVNWLRGRGDLLGIEPKTHVALSLAGDPVLRQRLVLVPTVMAVLLIITLGVATYLARRS